jgi:predicted RNase H-like nuclease
MVEPTDIEKKSLEAHVELCAQRYNALEQCIKDVKDDVSEMKTVINEVRDIVHAMSEKRTDQLLKWGVGIIGGLCATVAWFATHYFKT